MQIDIIITSQPIDLLRPSAESLDDQTGAVACFTGFVRPCEGGRIITALQYDVYQPMAERLMRRIIEEIASRHPCRFVSVTHRIGIIPVGQAAIHVVSSATHRAEAFAMLSQFMDRLKQDVPIWKCRALDSDPLPGQPSP
jgi:molybdopterin synthase catalytic subunit